MATGQDNVDAADLHRRMLKIATPDDRARLSWKRGRARYLTGLRLLKLRFMAKQRHSFRRAMNLLVFLLERKRAAQVHYLPPVVTVEAINGCNLHCPECPTGLSSPSSRRKGKASLEDLKSVDRSDLQEERPDQLPSHGRTAPERRFLSGLRLRGGEGACGRPSTATSTFERRTSPKESSHPVCATWSSPATARRRRSMRSIEREGTWNWCFETCGASRSTSRQVGSRFPWITAQFIIFDHNWHEMERFQERAIEAGAQRDPVPAGLPQWNRQVGPRLGRRSLQPLATGLGTATNPPLCGELWETPILTYDGGLFPCCFCYRDQDLFAPRQSPSGRTLADHWNGHAYRTARGFFLGGPVRREDLPQPCRHCGRTMARPSDPEPARAKYDRSQAMHRRSQSPARGGKTISASFSRTGLLAPPSWGWARLVSRIR